MKDISIYFSPVSETLNRSEERLGAYIYVHDEHGFPELNEKGVALIYVPEYRNTTISGTGSNESFRQSLYDFYRGDAWNDAIYDLGTIQPGERVEDTYFALAQVVAELAKKSIIPIIVGGRARFDISLLPWV